MWFLVVSLYSGSVKDKENKELRAVSEYLQSELDIAYDGVVYYAKNNSIIRNELLELESRKSVYYDVKDLKVMTFSDDVKRIVYAPKKYELDLSGYDNLFVDTPCGKVVGGYTFKYIDPALKSASVNGALVSYNKVLYCGDGGNDGYMGVCFIANGEVIYRIVFKNNIVQDEYSYKSSIIVLENLVSVLGIEDENAKFNAEELKVIEDSLNGENSLRLK